jgi:PAS domain S-box-containing protein
MDDNTKTKEELIAELEVLRQKLAKLEQSSDEQRERDHRARVILDNQYQFAGLLDINGIIIETSQTALDAAGIKRSEVIGRNFWETVWWIGAHESQRKLIEAIPKAAKGEFVRFEAEHFLGDDKENPIIVDFSLKPIRNEEGEIVYLLPEGRDITEKKKAEAELASKNAELAKKHEELLYSYQKVDRIFSALTDALPGTVLDGKYRLDNKIGTGAYGAVYRGTHLSLNHPIAVKVFRPNQGSATMEDLARFSLEGVSAVRVNHPNAVAILDSGVSSESIPFLVMELLNGHSLAEEIYQKGRLSLARSIEIAIPICHVLSKAHAMGIVHRDVKPENIFLHSTEDCEIVKVVDFGIAKLIDKQTDPKVRNLTEAGTVLGTPAYLSPERLTNRKYDGRSDVYSLGIVMYEMLTGQVPFDPDFHSLAEVMIMHIKEPPPPPRKLNHDIPEAVETLILRSLAKDPNDRPTAQELAQELTLIVGAVDS